MWFGSQETSIRKTLVAAILLKMLLSPFVFIQVIEIVAGFLPDRNALVSHKSSHSADFFDNVKLTSFYVEKANSYSCSVDEIMSDPCFYQFDGVCDGNSTICAEKSDCFDCDPCFQLHFTCGSCVADPACKWCESIDPVTQNYFGICSSVDVAQVFPSTCGEGSSEAYGSICPTTGNSTNSTGTCNIFTDSCMYQFDLYCDSMGDVTLCPYGTDCFDCDPCQQLVTEAMQNSTLDLDAICNICVDAGCSYCTAPALDGTIISVCTSPYLASVVPDICVSSGGSTFQETCSGKNATPAPAPTNTNFSESCIYSRDSCLFALDGKCDSLADSDYLCDPNSDCIDCDPCQQKRYDGCDACVAAGCHWCPFDALCLSGNPMLTGGIGTFSFPFPKKLSCTRAEDFTTTCPASNNDSNIYDDPLYDAQSWVYDLISVQDVWKSGISKYLQPCS